MTKEEINTVLTDLLHLLATQIKVESTYYSNTLYGEFTYRQWFRGTHKLTKKQDTLVQLVSNYNHSAYALLITMTNNQAIKQDLLKQTEETTNKITLNQYITLQEKLVDYILQVLVLLIPQTEKSTHTRLKGLATNTRSLQQDLMLTKKTPR